MAAKKALPCGRAFTNENYVVVVADMSVIVVSVIVVSVIVVSVVAIVSLGAAIVSIAAVSLVVASSFLQANAKSATRAIAISVRANDFFIWKISSFTFKICRNCIESKKSVVLTLVALITSLLHSLRCEVQESRLVCDRNYLQSRSGGHLEQPEILAQ
ncbi:MAG TPA: hypothetical protein VIL97_10290 [Thermoanaerobaculia bacterium]